MEATGKKLAQQIVRWKEIGGIGGKAEFLAHAESLAAAAKAAGESIVGEVGYLNGTNKVATIYKQGSEYLVVQGNKIVSYVAKAADQPGGIVEAYLKAGGKP